MFFKEVFCQIKVFLHNLSNRQAELETVDRKSKVVFEKIDCLTFTEVSDFTDSVTERNEQGFCSTEVIQKK